MVEDVGEVPEDGLEISHFEIFEILLERWGETTFARYSPPPPFFLCPVDTGRDKSLAMPWRAERASVNANFRATAWIQKIKRKPRLLLRLPGSFLLRLAQRRFLASLFQEPPRLTRLEPFSAFTAFS